MPVTYKKIGSATAGSGGTANFTFSSIPSTYTDLHLKFSIRNVDNLDFGYIEFNGSSANFSSRRLQADAVNPPSSGSTATNQIVAIYNPSGYTANTFASAEIYIPNYAESTNKSFSVDSVLENNATGTQMILVAGLWSNTAAINSILIKPYSGNFAQYSTATLYGISKS